MIRCKVCKEECILHLYEYKNKKFEYYKCLTCESVYKNFEVDNPHTAPLKVSKNDFLSKAKSYHDSYVDTIMMKYYSGQENFLDIGCFDGALLYYLHEKYKVDTNSLYGVDINLEAIQFSKNYLVQCYQTSFPDKEFTKKFSNKFSIIHSSENIYYLENPYEAINSMKELLVDNGVIILKLTQNSSRYFQKFPIHIRVSNFQVMINIETIKFISKKLNLEIIDIVNFDKNYLFNYLGYSNKKTQPKEKKSFLLRVLNKIIKSIPFVPYKYSDKLIVVLRKKVD